MFAARAGQAAKRLFSLGDLMRDILQIERMGAIRVQDMEHAFAQIGAAKYRAFLRKRIKRRLIQGEISVRVAAKTGEQIIRYGAHAAPPVQMQRIFARRQANDVADAVVAQMKAAALLVIEDRHGEPPSSSERE